MVLTYSGDWNHGTTNIQRKVYSTKRMEKRICLLVGPAASRHPEGPQAPAPPEGQWGGSCYSPKLTGAVPIRIFVWTLYLLLCHSISKTSQPKTHQKKKIHQIDSLQLKTPGYPPPGSNYTESTLRLGSCTFRTPRGDFPGSPVVKTPNFQCKGRGFNPCSGS